MTDEHPGFCGRWKGFESPALSPRTREGQGTRLLGQGKAGLARPKSPQSFTIRVVGLLLILVSFTTFAAATWKEKVLYSFQGGNNDGAVPAGGVVFDAAGNLYGATGQGFGFCAPIECGSVYELSPPLKQGDPWTETVLHAFAGHSQGDGNTPDGGVITDSSGNLYGTTAYGGTGNCILLGTAVGCGTVWELSPPKTKGGEWIYATLYSFPTSKQGYVPNGNLVLDSGGNLYGATMFGGRKGTTCNGFYGGQCGVVFEVSPPKQKGGKWTQKVLHNFAGGTDGGNPNGGLVLDNKGAVYGTTQIGGYNCAHHSGQGCGTVFEFDPPIGQHGTWDERQLHRFKDGQDGASPMAGLIFDQSGNLYGTTQGGGSVGWGVVFCLKQLSIGSRALREIVLHSFNGLDNDGAGPTAGLVFDSRGDLYGTTAIATNRSVQGNVFRMQPNTKGGPWAFSLVYAFAGSPDGAYPNASLVFDRQGSLYSTTQFGGTEQSCQGGCGTVFEVKK